MPKTYVCSVCLLRIPAGSLGCCYGSRAIWATPAFAVRLNPDDLCLPYTPENLRFAEGAAQTIYEEVENGTDAEEIIALVNENKPDAVPVETDLAIRAAVLLSIKSQKECANDL